MKDDPSKLCDEELVSLAIAGDRAAFDILCERHLSNIYRRLRALLPPEAVEDVTQEVFVAALRGLRQFRGNSLFRTWLSSIARHKVADYYRKQNRRPEAISLDEVGPQASGEPWEEGVMVRVALGKLKHDYQEVLLLRFAEGLQFQQIAETLDISLDAAKSRYRRALETISAEIKALDTSCKQ